MDTASLHYMTLGRPSFIEICLCATKVVGASNEAAATVQGIGCGSEMSKPCSNSIVKKKKNVCAVLETKDHAVLGMVAWNMVSQKGTECDIKIKRLG